MALARLSGHDHGMPSPQADVKTSPPADQVVIEREDAEEYARWFQALADATRIVILSYLAHCDEPVAVGTIVEHLGIGQSTVSHHLRVLHDVGFVTRERSRTNRLYAVNRNCINKFPAAAEVIMGRRRPEQ